MGGTQNLFWGLFWVLNNILALFGALDNMEFHPKIAYISIQPYTHAYRKRINFLHSNLLLDSGRLLAELALPVLKFKITFHARTSAS